MPINPLTANWYSSTILRFSAALFAVLMLLKPISAFGAADDCNLDVMCRSNTSPNQRAVAKYVIAVNRNCTGTLLNNTNMDHTPYFATARHCFEDQNGNVNSAYALGIKITWGYQTSTPPCDPESFSGTPTPNNSTEQTQNADILVDDKATDFILLKLHSAPPSGVNAYYAGWDIGGTVPLTNPGVLGIHHPQGEAKAVSLSKNQLTHATYIETTDGSNPGGSSNTGNHWRVDWDENGRLTDNGGTTERGSSGSCLFDVSTGRCIGVLHGQYLPSCNNGDTRTYYGKLSETWKHAPLTLRQKLDPSNIINSTVTGIEGDTHITTMNGVHYDFQGAGEFVSLRDPNGLEIQTRQAPVPTANTIADSYSELPVCVSINTAVAARVGGHRVSYQPTTSSTPDPNSLELIIDGTPAAVGQNGFNLSGGGRLVKTAAPGGLEFDFPDGSVLFATPNWWNGPNIWYFNINLTRPLAIDGIDASSFPIGGIAGPIESGNWLPRLPDGSPMGPRPGGLQERYVDLYQKFADAWRVTDDSSLFKYAKGTSTENFTLRTWPPPLNSPCAIPQGQVLGAPTHVPVKPVKPQDAKKACSGITDKHARQNCIFDAQVTGDLGFAKVYRFSERVVDKSTRTTVGHDKKRLGLKEQAVFTATVAQARAAGKDIPTGSVQFMVDGRKVGKPQPLDRNGQAIWKAPHVQIDKQEVTARYIPNQKSKLLPSMSALKEHMVGRD